MLLAVALACAAVGTSAAGASADGCPGSGTSACPYARVQIVGQRAEGMLRFPEAVAVDTQGDVYVADQLSYVVQKFTAGGAFETEWGSYGGGHGQFGPIGGLATDAAGNVYVVDSSHDRIEKFDSSGNFITDWGRTRQRTRPVQLRLLAGPDPASGRRHRGRRGTTCSWPTRGNNRIERFNLEGGEAMQWGTHGSLPGQFSYPRGVAANEGEVLVSDDDNHRIEKFSPEGAFEAEAGSHGTGPGQFGFPYGVALDAAGNVYVADDINHRVVKLTPQLAFAGAWGGLGSKPGQLAFPRALASDPAGDTYVADTANDRVEVYDTNGNFLRTIGTSARGPGGLVGTARPGGSTRPAGCSSPTRSTIASICSPPAATRTPGSGRSPAAHSTGFRAPAGIGIDPRGSVYVADTGNGRLARLWGEGTFLEELGGPADLGGAQLSGAGSVAVSAATGQIYVADTNHNRVLVYGAEPHPAARSGAPAKATEPRAAARARSTIRAAVAVGGSGDVYVADTANNRIVELSPSGSVLAEWGSRGTGNGRLHSPDGVAVDAAGEVYVLDGENNRVRGVRRAPGASWPSGAFAARTPASSPNRARSRWTAAATCTWRIPTTTASSASIPSPPAGVGCLAPGAGRRRWTSRRCCA